MSSTWLRPTRLALIACLAGVAGLLLACGGSSEAGWDAPGIAASIEDAPVTPIIANSPLGVGRNRVSIAVTEGGALVDGASVRMRVYRLADDPEAEPEVAELRDEESLTPRSLTISSDHVHADGTVHEHEGPVSTIYVANVEFDAEGYWGLEVDVEVEGERYEGLRMETYVSAQTYEPWIGVAVPRSVQRTMRDVADVSEIDSSTVPHPELHELTIAEALETGEPVVVAFATPAFCQTRFCGPVLENVVVPAWEEYGDRVAFVHVEPYDLEQARSGSLVPVPAVGEWGLQSEPWVFVLNPDGTVAAKFEGILDASELTDALEAVLG